MKTIAIIQARMGSSRLPGKVLMDLSGEPLLHRVVSRTKRAKLIDHVVIATSLLPRDDAIVDVCRIYGWDWFRGSEHDVLDRYYRAARQYEADAVVRITSDCPLIDPEVIDDVLRLFREQEETADYVSNVFPTRTFPRGLDTEVVSAQALTRAWNEDQNPAWREHVTVYVQRHPDRFASLSLTHPVDYSAMRWTVDTLEDLTFVRHIYDSFGSDSFSWLETLKLLEHHPDWLEINQHIQQVVVE